MPLTLLNRQKRVNRLFPQACVILGSFPRAFTPHIQVVRQVEDLQVVRAAGPVDKINRIKTRPQKGILNGKACTKERFRNDPTRDGFSKVWTLRNGIAGEIRLAIPFCNVDRVRSRVHGQKRHSKRASSTSYVKPRSSNVCPRNRMRYRPSARRNQRRSSISFTNNLARKSSIGGRYFKRLKRFHASILLTSLT